MDCAKRLSCRACLAVGWTHCEAGPPSPTVSAIRRACCPRRDRVRRRDSDGPNRRADLRPDDPHPNPQVARRARPDAAHRTHHDPERRTASHGARRKDHHPSRRCCPDRGCPRPSLTPRRGCAAIRPVCRPLFCLCLFCRRGTKFARSGRPTFYRRPRMKTIAKAPGACCLYHLCERCRTAHQSARRPDPSCLFWNPYRRCAHPPGNAARQTLFDPAFDRAKAGVPVAAAVRRHPVCEIDPL